MIKNNKIKLIFSSILILLPILIGIIRWDTLKKAFQVNGVTGGTFDQETGLKIFVFALPVFLLTLHWVAIFITAREFKKKPQSDKVFGVLIWILPLVSIVSSAVTHLTSTDSKSQLYSLLFVFFGAIFVLIGNYLPKTRPNRVYGMRIAWTLESEDNWYATHRISGKLMVICGIIIILCALLPITAAFVISIIALLTSTVIPVVYSYRFHKKELREGKIDPSSNKKSKKWAWILPIIIVITVLPAMFFGEIEYSLSDDKITIDATFSSDINIRYEDIDSATLITNASYGTRSFGFGSFRLSLGTFKNAAYGSYKLYAYTNNKTAIELRVGESVILINAKTHNDTVKLFEELQEHIK